MEFEDELEEMDTLKNDENGGAYTVVSACRRLIIVITIFALLQVKNINRIRPTRSRICFMT